MAKQGQGPIMLCSRHEDYARAQQFECFSQRDRTFTRLSSPSDSQHIRRVFEEVTASVRETALLAAGDGMTANEAHPFRKISLSGATNLYLRASRVGYE